MKGTKTTEKVHGNSLKYLCSLFNFKVKCIDIYVKNRIDDSQYDAMGCH